MTAIERVTAASPKAKVSYSGAGEGYPASNAPQMILREPPIPASFYRALADIKAERIVDMQKAHDEVPPFTLG